MDISLIEEWISNIEKVVLPNAVKERRIQELISLWKFSSNLNEQIVIQDSLKLYIPGQGEVGTVVTDLDLSGNGYSNQINKILEEKEIQLLNENKIGFYSINFNTLDGNFTTEKLQDFKNELDSCFNGNLISYPYIKQLHKKNILQHQIQSGLKVKALQRTNILKAIAKKDNSNNDQGKWLILVLDNHQSNCDSFFIQDDVLHLPFESNFEKIFLFDFFKTEIIELNCVPRF